MDSNFLNMYGSDMTVVDLQEFEKVVTESILNYKSDISKETVSKIDANVLNTRSEFVSPC